MNDTFSRVIGLFLLALSCIAVSACSLPRLIILNDPLSSAEHDDLGKIYEAQGKNEIALEQYQAALEKDPKFYSALMHVGDLAYRMNLYGVSEKAYKKALQIQPENGDIYNNLCWVYLKQGANAEQSLELVRKALELTPAHQAYYLDTLGVALQHAGRYPESIDAFMRSLSLLREEERGAKAEVYDHLADVYRAVGEGSKAEGARRSAESCRTGKAPSPQLQATPQP